MNDYLSNLSARSFEHTEGIPFVSPRVPSLFEPSQGLLNVSAEIPLWPSANDQPNDETTPPSLTSVGEIPKRREQATERYVGIERNITTASEDVSYPHRAPLEVLTGTPERSPQDYVPVAAALPRQALHTVTPVKTSAKPRDNGSLQPTVRDGKRTDPPEMIMASIAAERPAATPQGKSKPSFHEERREEMSAEPQNKPQKERLVVENVMVKERVERIFDSDVSSKAEVGEDQNVIIPKIMQQPLQETVRQTVRPMVNLWTNSGHHEVPEKAEPTIQVTIGRIEVRAVSQPALNGPTPKRTKPMSLDEYLRGRNGGGR